MTTTFAIIILTGIALHVYTLDKANRTRKYKTFFNRISWLALAVSTTFAFLLLFV